MVKPLKERRFEKSKATKFNPVFSLPLEHVFSYQHFEKASSEHWLFIKLAQVAEVAVVESDLQFDLVLCDSVLQMTGQTIVHLGLS